jgi:hypothetical protein
MPAERFLSCTGKLRVNELQIPRFARDDSFLDEVGLPIATSSS